MQWCNTTYPRHHNRMYILCLIQLCDLVYLVFSFPGISCSIYESSLQTRKQGFGLTLSKGSKAFAELGVLEECIKMDCLSSAHLLKPDGQILGYYGRELQEPQEQEGGAKGREKQIDDESGAETYVLQRLSEAYSAPSSTPSSSSSSSSSSPSTSILPSFSPSSTARATIHWSHRLLNYTEDHSVPPLEHPITLTFEDGTTATCDILVGADGIHSVVRKLRDEKENKEIRKDNGKDDEEVSDKNELGLKYLNVAVIIGLSAARHPLLDTRGIYIVDGESRLFTMPFRKQLTDEIKGKILQQQLTMWQLSFRCENELEAKRIKSLSYEELLHFTLQKTCDWISPVSELIRNTPAADLWSTPLYDRNPLRLRSRTSSPPSLVTLVGDAAHPMSMFKGQGANQALSDGPTLVQWVRYQHARRRDTHAGKMRGMTW